MIGVQQLERAFERFTQFRNIDVVVLVPIRPAHLLEQDHEFVFDEAERIVAVDVGPGEDGPAEFHELADAELPVAIEIGPQKSVLRNAAAGQFLQIDEVVAILVRGAKKRERGALPFIHADGPVLAGVERPEGNLDLNRGGKRLEPSRQGEESGGGPRAAQRPPSGRRHDFWVRFQTT